MILPLADSAIRDASVARENRVCGLCTQLHQHMVYSVVIQSAAGFQPPNAARAVWCDLSSSMHELSVGGMISRMSWVVVMLLKREEEDGDGLCCFKVGCWTSYVFWVEFPCPVFAAPIK